MTGIPELEDKPCPLGCESADELVLQGRDILNGLPGEFNVVRCRGCGLMRTNPRPTPASIGMYYPDNYGPYVHTAAEVSRKQLPGWKRFIKRFITPDDNHVPSLPPGRMLEVGCASGSYLQSMASAGWQVQGIEFSPHAAQNARARGFEVHAGAIESAPEPGHPFDLIVGWMVLEHLHEPVRALTRLAGWTEPGGWLVLSVPNAASLEFRVFKDCWYALQLPCHLSHFTPRTLTRMLQRGGWRVQEIHHQQNLSNLVASMGHVLEQRQRAPRLAAALRRFPNMPGWPRYAMYPFAKAASWFGQTGRMTVWARKPG